MMSPKSITDFVATDAASAVANSEAHWGTGEGYWTTKGRWVGAHESRLLETEQAMADENNMGRSTFAPPGPEHGGPSTWRGQNCRPGTGKYSNRGGNQRALYAEHKVFFREFQAAKSLGKCTSKGEILKISGLSWG